MWKFTHKNLWRVQQYRHVLQFLRHDIPPSVDHRMGVLRCLTTIPTTTATTTTTTTRRVGGKEMSPPHGVSASNHNTTGNNHQSSTTKVLRIRTQDDRTAYASAKRLLERSIAFLNEKVPPPRSSSSTVSSSSWTDDDLKQASDILHAMSRQQQHQQVPKDLLPSWISVMDDLLCLLLHQSTDGTAAKTKTTTTKISVFPDSKVFSSIIVLYSKVKGNIISNNNRHHHQHPIHTAAERAEYWLQEMIRLSRDYPNLVSPPRATLFASVLGGWERLAPNPKAIQHGERLWRQLQNTNGIEPTSSGYYLYLSLWCKSIDNNDPTRAPEMAERILRQMIEASRTNPKLLPTQPAFVNVISCWRKAGQQQRKLQQQQQHHHHHGSSLSHQNHEIPFRAQAVLDLLLSEHVRRSKLPQEWMRMEALNDIPFNATIQTWADSSLPQAEEQIDSIIHTTMANAKVVPTIITTWSALPVYDTIQRISHNSTTTATTQTLVDIPAKVLSLMEYINHWGSNQNPVLDLQIYSRALDIVCRYAGTQPDNCDAIDAADEILKRYLHLPKEDRRIDVTMECFEQVVEAWKVHCSAHCTATMPPTPPPSDRRQTGSERIIHHLERMEQEAERIYEHRQTPSVFACVASAWAKSGAPNSVGKTEEFVHRLLDSAKEQQARNPLQRGWLQHVIRAVKENFSKEESEEFVKRLSQRLARSSQLYQMIEDTTSSDEQFSEDVFCGILDCLAKSGDRNAGQRAEIILLKMQEIHDAGNENSPPPPTFETFQKVLTCWSNSQEEGAAQRADDILHIAESLYEEGDVRLRPTLEGYMSVVNAWSQSHSPEAPDKIQRHLKKMQRLKSRGEVGFDLDDRLYAALINAYANSGRPDASVMAEAILDATPEEYKTVAVYNAFICAQGGDSNKAEATLQMMQYEYMEQNNEKIKPNTETFNSVLLVWLRSASPMAAWRADGIFKRMTDLTDSGKLDVRPNSRTFDLVISTLAQDWVAELRKVDRYLELLKEYYQSGAPDCVPTVTSYTEAIRAWGSNNDDGRAMLRAKALLDEMHELAGDGVDSVRPNRRTYEVYLRALSRSPIEGRVELTADVLAQMKTNNVDVDVDLQPYIQRCMVNFEKQNHVSASGDTS